MTGSTINTGSYNFNRPAGNNAPDVEKIIRKGLINWHWFLTAVILAIGLAFIYNLYTTPIYEIRSTLLISEDKSNSPLTALYGGGEGKFEGIQFMNNRENIYNQIVILGSTSIISKALEELDFKVSYYSVGRVKETEIYKDAPFRIILDEKIPQVVETDFYLTIEPDKKMTVKITGENAKVYDYREGRIVRKIPDISYEKQIMSGKNLNLNDLSFSVLLNENFNPDTPHRYKFRFHSHESLVNKYRSLLFISLPDDYSSILHLAVKDFNVTKGIDFLNKLTEVYQIDNLDRKNENFSRTIQFINAQLENISDSLSISANRLETFQSSNKMIDISVQSQQLLEELSALDKELVSRETQNKYYKYLQEYIKGNQELETVIAPSSMGIEDPLLNNFINQLNELITEKSSKTSIRQGSQHPTIVKLNTQIENVKRSLLESIENIIRQSETEIEILNERINTYNYRIRRLPSTERNFVNFERKYNIDSETYTFLLQKLSEAQIAMASSVPDSQVIEDPKNSALVQPKPKKIYAMAFMLGLIIPFIIIFTLDFFNDKILSEDDIEVIASYPVIGSVLHDQTQPGSQTLVLDNPRSPGSDQFRDIRGRLNLMTKEKEHPFIAFLSVSPREGKTFNVINIASSFALIPKRVVVLDLNLRDPKIREEFDIKSDTGIVDYLNGEATFEEIIYQTNHPMLDVIPAGLVPPNPAEMLLNIKIFELIKMLKDKYDVIVADSSPLGSVTDILSLNEIIDASVIVVRKRYTEKKDLKNILEKIENFKMKEPGIIIYNTDHKNRWLQL